MQKHQYYEYIVFFSVFLRSRRACLSFCRSWISEELASAGSRGKDSKEQDHSASWASTRALTDDNDEHVSVQRSGSVAIDEG